LAGSLRRLVALQIAFAVPQRSLYGACHMDIDWKLRELLEKQIADALQTAETNAKPQLQALLLRVRAAKNVDEMTRLTRETAEALGRSDEASTWLGRWNIVKRLFGK